MSDATESRELTLIERADRANFAVGENKLALIPQTFDAVYTLARIIHKSSMAPYGFTAEMCTVAIMHGLEVGLTPMAALQSIAVIKGRPTIWGDGALGLIRASGLLEAMHESVEGTGDQMVAVCHMKRKGEPGGIETEFSVEDAKAAGLWDERKEVRGRDGTMRPNDAPWFRYPKRMLQMRARGFCIRDGFADVLKGLHIREEVNDYPDEPPALPAKAGIVERLQSRRSGEAQEGETAGDASSTAETPKASQEATAADDGATKAAEPKKKWPTIFGEKMRAAATLAEAEEIWAGIQDRLEEASPAVRRRANELYDEIKEKLSNGQADQGEEQEEGEERSTAPDLHTALAESAGEMAGNGDRSVVVQDKGDGDNGRSRGDESQGLPDRPQAEAPAHAGDKPETGDPAGASGARTDPQGPRDLIRDDDVPRLLGVEVGEDGFPVGSGEWTRMQKNRFRNTLSDFGSATEVSNPDPNNPGLRQLADMYRGKHANAEEQAVFQVMFETRLAEMQQ